LTTAILAGVLLVAGLATPSGRAVTGWALRATSTVRVLVVAAVLTAVLALLAQWYVEVRLYGMTMVVSTAAFVGLFLLAMQASSLSTSFSDWLLGRSVLVLASGSVVLGVVACWLVLDAVPHISDEVAYLFQAGALSAGRLTQPTGPVPEAFTTTHTLLWHGQWFGIMNPGWPLLLAAGVRAGVPWLVNPLVGGSAVAAFWWYCREAGLPEHVAKVAALFLVVSPFAVFQNASFMSHTAHLALFLVFAASWMRFLKHGNLRDAMIAGSVLVLGVLVRPVDMVVALIPFAVAFLATLRVRRDRLAGGSVVVVAAVIAVGLTLAYNHVLTGNALTMPTSLYFNLRNPAERFGLGFGADMGTTMHGEEWPGFFPADAVRVSAYRLSELLLNVAGAPVLIVAALLGSAWWRGPGVTALAWSAFAMVALYFFHFYHGVAYGARHLYLALPVAALAVALPLGAALDSASAEARLRAKAAITATIAFLVMFAFPPVVREYGSRYRGVDGSVRDAVARSGLSNAVVFVDSLNWAWKAAFPLNSYPLEENRVLMARDRGAGNTRVMTAFPGRQFYRLSVANDGRVNLAPLSAADSIRTSRP
jgi:hypothetical protein